MEKYWLFFATVESRIRCKYVTFASGYVLPVHVADVLPYFVHSGFRRADSRNKTLPVFKAALLVLEGIHVGLMPLLRVTNAPMPFF